MVIVHYTFALLTTYRDHGRDYITINLEAQIQVLLSRCFHLSLCCSITIMGYLDFLLSLIFNRLSTLVTLVVAYGLISQQKTVRIAFYGTCTL